MDLPTMMMLVHVSFPTPCYQYGFSFMNLGRRLIYSVPKLLNLSTMASTRSPSHMKRPAALNSDVGGDVDEFTPNAKNHKPNDETFGNRLDILKKRYSKVKEDGQSSCEKHVYTNLSDSSICGLQRPVVIYYRDMDGANENVMVKWKGHTRHLGEYLKYVACQEGVCGAKGLGAFGALYAGAEQGPGAYHGVNMKHASQGIDAVLEPCCWYFLSEQGDLATIFKKLSQWFVKAGSTTPSLATRSPQTKSTRSPRRTWALGSVIDIPDTPATSLA